MKPAAFLVFAGALIGAALGLCLRGRESTALLYLRHCKAPPVEPCEMVLTYWRNLVPLAFNKAFGSAMTANYPSFRIPRIRVRERADLSVSFVPINQSCRLFEVSYSDPDPHIAQAVTTQLVTRLLDAQYSYRMPDLPNCLDDEHCGFSNLEVMDPGDPQRLPLFPYVLAGTAEGLIAAFLYFLGR